MNDNAPWKKFIVGMYGWFVTYYENAIYDYKIKTKIKNPTAEEVLDYIKLEIKK